MAPPARFVSFQQRTRQAFPLRLGMRWSLDRMQRRSAEEIVRYQERRLRLLVRLAASRSDFYRDWFAGAGVDPASIRTLADLEKLPLLDRSHLVHRPERFLVYPRLLTWVAHSSGTSGQVVTVHRTPGSSVYELASLQRQWSWFDVPHRPRSLLLRSSDPDPEGAGVLTREIPATRQLLVSSFRLGQEQLPQLVDQIRAFDPQVVEGWPSSITILASLLRERGERLPVRAVITSSEVMTVEQLTLMREVFDGPVVDHYGQTERVVMAGACEAGGYHEFPDYGIVELLPVEGREDRWEIVGTPLHNWGFPLFRYRTGDEVGPRPTAPCPCGRAFPLLGKIDGRVEDSFTAANGRPLPLPSVVLDDLVGLREVQVAQLAPGCFEFRLVPGTGADTSAAEEQARRNVEKYFGPDQTVTFRVMSEIPREGNGKLRAAVRLSAPS
ncbi:phenylacetate-CoA ligase [Friedmanniella luteola]|uniref:Phenylacetate-CoA ligase n=1 Tax=Friedmanniella luteola TaxID=546871 RepID=A0A1H1NRC4_9ACTN|nr:phenylacetate--CoA ligase family protein [Friedmanniella luteola]SDS01554.1 phenylacetate-CoA ligase [Friedmanniella luteola]